MTTEGSGQATGLRLAMGHDVCERQGGQSEVNSAHGDGREFSMAPRVDTPAATAVGSTMAPLPSTSTAGTILVVDDDGAVRRLARVSLEHHGFTVIEAESGNEALETWEEHGAALDLLFTDLVMPGGMNGLQLIQACRARQPGIPAILSSGYTLPALGGSSGLPADVVLLAKPFAHHALTDTVQRTIAAARRANGARAPG